MSSAWLTDVGFDTPNWVPTQHIGFEILLLYFIAYSVYTMVRLCVENHPWTRPTPPAHQDSKRVVRSTTPRAHPGLITLLLQRT